MCGVGWGGIERSGSRNQEGVGESRRYGMGAKREAGRNQERGRGNQRGEVNQERGGRESRRVK